MHGEYNKEVMSRIWANGEGKEVSALEASGGLITWWDKIILGFNHYLKDDIGYLWNLRI